MTKAKSKSAARSKYTGVLAEPIYEPIDALGMLNANGGLFEQQAKKGASDRQLEKLLDLFEWHNVDPTRENRWMVLCFALAETHVPGMRIIHERLPRRGPKMIWKAGLGNELLVDVKNLQAKSPNLTFEAAI